MKLIGNVRLGRDVELRYVGNNQTPVATLFGAYNYGKKDAENKRPTQWVEATLWGNQAEALQPYLLKGEQFLLTMSDVHVETYTKQSGETGVKLTGTIMPNGGIDFVGGSQRPAEGQQRQQSAPRQPQRQAPASHGSGFDDMSDDIPF